MPPTPAGYPWCYPISGRPDKARTKQTETQSIWQHSSTIFPCVSAVIRIRQFVRPVRCQRQSSKNLLLMSGSVGSLSLCVKSKDTPSSSGRSFFCLDVIGGIKHSENGNRWVGTGALFINNNPSLPCIKTLSEISRLRETCS